MSFSKVPAHCMGTSSSVVANNIPPATEQVENGKERSQVFPANIVIPDSAETVLLENRMIEYVQQQLQDDQNLHKSSKLGEKDNQEQQNKLQMLLENRTDDDADIETAPADGGDNLLNYTTSQHGYENLDPEIEVFLEYAYDLFYRIRSENIDNVRANDYDAEAKLFVRFVAYLLMLRDREANIDNIEVNDNDGDTPLLALMTKLMMGG